MCDHCGENSANGQVLLKCDRCEFRSHGGCTFPPVKAQLTSWFCNDCVHRGATRPSCCLQCGDAGANASCSTCLGRFHKKCIRSARCSPCRRSDRQTIRTWRMVLLDRRQHVSAKAYNSWVLVLEGKVGGKLIRTKEIIGVVPPRLLRTLDNCTVTLHGAPCIAWPPTPFDLDQLDSFREGFPEDWVTRIRPTNGDTRNRARRGALPRPWPPAVASSVEAKGCDVLPENSVVLRRFITGWKLGRVKKTIMIDGMAKVLVHYMENKYGDVLSLRDINDLGQMMWVFKANEDGWTDPEVETLACAVKGGLRWDEVAEKVAAVAPGSSIIPTEEWCSRKAHKLRLAPPGPKAAEQLKERLKRDAQTMEKPIVDMFRNSNVIGPTVDPKTLRKLESDCPDIDEPNKENVGDVKSDVESVSDGVFASPQATARSRFVFQHVNHRRQRTDPALRIPGAKVQRKASRSEHEALTASLSNLLRRKEKDEETDEEKDIDETPRNSVFL
eukprot:GEMP01008677.1.p1 GENE.GEMP01008677.1~~GEMP01008677.1.p1  ORF type:complete len:499 (+),score=105.45 GEMP01008677.1:114-1610(+)